MKKLNLNYETLENSKFYMVIYKNAYGKFTINYTVNITKKAIKAFFDQYNCLELVSIKKITLNEYIQNNLAFSEVEHIKEDVFNVEFWQKDIFKISGLFQFDKIFNIPFPVYELRGNELKEILDIQEKDREYLLDYLPENQKGSLDLIKSKSELEFEEDLKIDSQLEISLMELQEQRGLLIEEINNNIMELRDKGNYKYYLLDESSLSCTINYLENHKKEILKYRMFINK